MLSVQPSGTALLHSVMRVGVTGNCCAFFTVSDHFQHIDYGDWTAIIGMLSENIKSIIGDDDVYWDKHIHCSFFQIAYFSFTARISLHFCVCKCSQRPYKSHLPLNWVEGCIYVCFNILSLLSGIHEILWHFIGFQDSLFYLCKHSLITLLN